jgi:PAS domain S-box-containing protein
MSSDVLAGGWARVFGSDRKQFNLFFDKMLDGFAYHKIVVDKSGKPIDYIFVEVNHAFERMTGLKREQIIGKKVTDVLVGIEKDPADWIGIYGKVALTGEPVQFENHAAPLNKWFRISAYCPEKGYFVALFEEITERKKTEEDLKNSLSREHFLAQLVRDASVAVGVGYPDGKLGMVNHAFEQLTGYNEKELKSISWNNVLTPIKWASLEKKKLQELQKNKAPVTYQKEYLRKDGSTVPIELIVHPFFDAYGNVTHYFSFITDISERKKAEEALSYNNQRLELLSHVTSQLLSTTNPQKLIQQICEEVMAFLKCDVFFNFLVDEQKQKLHLNAYAGVPAETAATFEWLSFGEAVCGCAAQEGNRIVCENIPDTQDHRTALVRSFGVKAYCANPIFSSGKVIGTLSFGSKRKLFFSADDLAVMKTVTAQVSVAMDKNRSEEALRESDERFRIALKNAPVSVAAQDCELRYIWAYNQKTANPKQIIGRLDSEIFTPEEAAHLDIIKRRVLKEGIEMREQQWFNRPEGPIFLDITWSPLRDSWGQIIGVSSATINLTDMKRAEIALQESEQRWSTTLDSIGDAVIATDTSGKIVFMNRVAEELTGWTLSESLQKPVKEVFNIINEHTRLEVENPIAKVLKQGIVVGLANHTVLIRKDGSEIPIDDSGAPIKDKDGKTTGVVLIFRDITKRQKAEEELKRSEEQARQRAEELRKLMDIIPAAVWLSRDPECKVIVGNQAANTFYEAEGDENVSAGSARGGAQDTTRRFFRNEKELMPQELPMQEAAAKNIEIKNSELEVVVPSGRKITILGNAKPLLDDVGNVRGCLGAFVDISERKKSEEAVARQAELIDLSPDAIIVRKFDGTITFWSKGAENLYGWKKEEAVGQNVNLLLKTKLPQSIDDIQNELKTKGKWSGEIVHICKDGSRLVVQSYWLGKFGSDGKIIEMLESNVDVTDRIQMQLKLEESAIRLEEYANQMEELANQRAIQLKDAERLAAIGATAGMVGHDIRNPLQAITGDLFLAKTELSALTDSEQKANALESLNAIEENIDYINKIVADLQDYARPLNPRAQETDVKLVVDGILAKNGVPKNIKVDVVVEDKAKKIMADPDYLKRIVANLTLNAIQAMPNGGKLTIHSHADTQTNDIIITFKDTGVGIPEAIKPKLFTPMMTTKSKGQGFGLAVVKRMTEALGGEVTFESQAGKGTTFTVRLPPKC